MQAVNLPRASARPFDLGSLLRGDAEVMAGWTTPWNVRLVLPQMLVIAVGAGAFGLAMGSWRAPEQAVWSGIKLPVVLLATAAGNALINGILAPLLGMNLRLSESFVAVLTSFALAAAMLGAFSPLMVFLVCNLPPPTPGAGGATAACSVMLLTLVGGIAFAGVAANVRLFQLLRRLGGESAAGRTLWSWLTVNLLLGSQLSWIARPFIGKAGEPVTFVEEHALRGNFFEEVGCAARDLWLHFQP